MNEPASREFSEKLQKMGCVSQSTYYWFRDNTDGIDKITNLPRDFMISISGGKVDDPNIRVFEQNDFTGATEQARENARIVWGAAAEGNDVAENIRYKYGSTYHRHSMIDHTATPWWQYIERTMREKL